MTSLSVNIVHVITFMVSVVGAVVERANIVVERIELSLSHVSVHYLVSNSSHVLGAAGVRVRVYQVVLVSVGRLPGGIPSFPLFVLLILTIPRLSSDRTVIVTW